MTRQMPSEPLSASVLFALMRFRRDLSDVRYFQNGKVKVPMQINHSKNILIISVFSHFAWICPAPMRFVRNHSACPISAFLASCLIALNWHVRNPRGAQSMRQKRLAV